MIFDLGKYAVGQLHRVKSRPPPSGRILLSYPQSLDNGPIEAVQLSLEATIFSPATILPSYIDSHGLARGVS